jgi:hypothetical protein
VTRDERLDLVDTLKAANAESRERIRQRQEERERNPELMDDHLRAERSAELGPSPPVSETGEPGALVYKRFENPPAPAPEPGGEPSDGDHELAHAIDVFAAAVERKLAAIERENDELRDAVARLQKSDEQRRTRDQVIAERSGRITELQRENAASHTELAAEQLAKSFAARDHRLDLVETKLGMLLKYLGADLPRGFLGRGDD